MQEYDIESAQDIQEVLKDLLGGTGKEMMENEMERHLGYGRSERFENGSGKRNYRNGTKPKTVNSSLCSFAIDVPQDRNCSFEPKVVRKTADALAAVLYHHRMVSDTGSF